MSLVEQNKEIVRRFNEEALGQGKLELLDELLHPDYVNYSADFRGLAAAREGFTKMAAGGTVQLTLHDMIAEGDKVAIRWYMVDGDKRYNGITINRIADGKIIEDWFCYDEVA